MASGSEDPIIGRAGIGLPGGQPTPRRFPLPASITGWHLIAVAVLAALVVGAVGVGLFTSRINRHVAQIDAGMDAAEKAMRDPTHLAVSDIALLQERVRSGQLAILALRRDTGPARALAPILQFLPEVGGDIDQADDVIAYALHLVQGADLTLMGLAPVLTSLADDQPFATRLAVAAGGLVERRQLFIAAAEQVQAAKVIRPRLSATSLSPRVQSRLSRGDALARRLDLMVIAGLQGGDMGPLLAEQILALGGQAAAFRGQLDRLERGEPFNFSAFYQGVAESIALLENLDRQVAGFGPALEFLDIEPGAVEENVAFYINFLQAAKAAMLGLQTLYEMAQGQLNVGPASVTLVQLSASATPLDEAAGLLGDVRRAEAAGRKPLPPSLDVMPSDDEIKLGLDLLEAGVAAGREIVRALDSADRAMKRYEFVSSTLPAYIADPVQLVFGGFVTPVGELTEGRAEIEIARAALGNALRRLESVHLDLGVDRQIADADAILAAAFEGFSAAQLALEGANSLASLTSHAAFSAEFSRTAVSVIPAAADQVSRAQAQVAKGIDAVKHLETSPAISPLSIGDIRARLAGLASALDRAGEFVELVGYVLGLDAPRTFLVLGQDDNEIRATGGFIGSVHEIVIDRGDLWIPQFLDSWDVDSSPAQDQVGPTAFCRYMLGGPCVQSFRDANWWPDFPTSAEFALKIYEDSQRIRADGVIAVDRWFMSDLVDNLGGAVLPGRAEPIDGDLARRFSSNHLYPCGPDNVKQRANRCFTEDLMDYLLISAQGNPSTSRTFLETLLHATGEKHVLTYLRNANAASILESLDWDGRLKDPEGDFLMIVDTSVYSKVHDWVQRTTEYDVTLNVDGYATATLTTTYDQQVDSIPPTPFCEQITDNWGCHWNYIRVLVPERATLLATPNFTLPDGTVYETLAAARGDDVRGSNTFSVNDDVTNSKTELSWLMVTNAGDSARFAMSYWVPGVVTRQADGSFRYMLTLQKQPGTRGDLVSVRIRLPDGSTPTGILPDGAVVDEGEVVIRVALEKDVTLSLVFFVR